MKCAIYARVSTRDKQHISMQLNNLRDYAERHELEVYDIYADKGASGAKASRPEWDRLLEDAKAKSFEAVLIYKLDRIGRSIANLMELFKDFQALGVRIVASTQSIDSSTPEGRMFRNMLAVFAEYEREMMIGKIYDGLADARKRGKKLGRPKGSKDKNKRRRIGYLVRWEKEKDKQT